MSVFKRGRKWSYDFWVNGKRYRGSIPEARVKAQAERAENAIRDQIYQGKYGKQEPPAPLLRDFITDTFLPWSKVNKRTWLHDEYRSRPLIKALGNKPMDEISPILIEKYKRGSTCIQNISRRRSCALHSQSRARAALKGFLVSDRSGINDSESMSQGKALS